MTPPPPRHAPAQRALTVISNVCSGAGVEGAASEAPILHLPGKEMTL